MFAHIEGTVAEKNADSIVLDVHGVGFLLTVSGATLAAAPAAGERMKLYTVLNVREDAMELFGFYSREEKRMFERLRSVSGVGRAWRCPSSPPCRSTTFPSHWWRATRRR